MSDFIKFTVIREQGGINFTANNAPITNFTVRGLVPVPDTGGNMLKSDYDSDGDGTVDEAVDSQRLGGVAATQYALKTDIGATILTFTAGASLSSGRAVIKDTGKVYYFDPTNVAHAGRILGITKTSAASNAPVDVQTSGIITDGAFLFLIDKPVFVGADGILVTTVPATRIIQRVGVSLATDKMNIYFSLPIIKIP